jgi:hypothetical protein
MFIVSGVLVKISLYDTTLVVLQRTIKDIHNFDILSGPDATPGSGSLPLSFAVNPQKEGLRNSNM